MIPDEHICLHASCFDRHTPKGRDDEEPLDALRIAVDDPEPPIGTILLEPAGEGLVWYRKKNGWSSTSGDYNVGWVDVGSVMPYRMVPLYEEPATFRGTRLIPNEAVLCFCNHPKGHHGTKCLWKSCECPSFMTRT